MQDKTDAVSLLIRYKNDGRIEQAAWQGVLRQDGGLISATPKHFDMSALKLQGREETGARKFWMGLSPFLPGGGAEFDASQLEKIYLVWSSDRALSQIDAVDTTYMWYVEVHSVQV